MITKTTLDKNSSLIKADNLYVEYIENFFDFDQSQLYMKHLTNDIKWKREKIRMWGKEIVTKKESLGMQMKANLIHIQALLFILINGMNYCLK